MSVSSGRCCSPCTPYQEGLDGGPCTPSCASEYTGAQPPDRYCSTPKFSVHLTLQPPNRAPLRPSLSCFGYLQM